MISMEVFMIGKQSMGRKTIVEEFDGNGKLIKRTITTQEDTPVVPNRPLQPWREYAPWDARNRIWC